LREISLLGRLSFTWLIFAVAAVVGVLVVTLKPDTFPAGVNLVPLRHHGYAFEALLRGSPNKAEILRYLFVDVVGNVVLFVPLGLAVAGTLGRQASLLSRLLVPVLFAAVLSTGIEVLQLIVPGRATDVDDVLFNSLGAAIGGLLLILVHWRRDRGVRVTEPAAEP
jgi:glycopeptide antibiotics resistance protein